MTPEQAGKIEANQMPVLGDDKKLIPFIPMEFLSEEMAMKNHGQTLQRLKERGGLCLSEVAAIIQKTDSISTRYTQLGSLAVILKQAIAGRSKGIEREKELEEKIKKLKGLIKDAHTAGWIDSSFEVEPMPTIEESWQQFKTENNL